MDNVKVFVAIYRPRYGNYHHWGLFMETGPDTADVIFEVTGSHPNFERNVVLSDPRNTQSLIEMIFMDEFSPHDIPMVYDIAEKTVVDNSTAEWDCQEYVLDILEKLEEECIVDEDDEITKKQRSK